ncbi:hypothetical protein PS691_00744 [Pseudomonas fluorescens]|uniref:Uncharacterized protein n=1 Tax=Pseudomonas fluorescens TaxID=294 RepID=A0A5E7ADJ2_PSEFL|nr:hypothetical protein PS691_00744 [Pseudomonas fluorescens]
MDVNDYACCLNKRAALESIASKPAPTGFVHSHDVAGVRETSIQPPTSLIKAI